MTERKYSASTLQLAMDYRQNLIEQDGVNASDGREFDPATIMGIFNLIGGLISQLSALCNKTPPTPPPVPTNLVAEGITPKAWGMAFQSQWAANEGWLPSKNQYHAKAVNKMAKEIAESKGTKKRLQKPAAIAALDTTRATDVEVLARAAFENGN